MRDRVLIRHFLWRFLEHDLLSPQSDRRGVLSAVGGLLTAAGLFAGVLLAAPYQFFYRMPPGVVSVRSLDDRFIFVSISMLVMAFAAVAEWDALALDPRDTAVLGPLPIPHRVIARAKLAALALFAVAVLTACNIGPVLLRAAAVPAGLHLGWIATVQLTLAHAFTTAAAGSFGFLTVVALREALRALLGVDRFRHVSSAVQTMLIVLLATMALLLPSHSSRIGERWLLHDRAITRLVPPLWFVGLHETLAGPVIDTLPRTTGRDRLAREDQIATDLYRSIRPAFASLRDTALLALLFALNAALTGALWNSRRLPLSDTRPKVAGGMARRALSLLATRALVRAPLQQAGFFFTMQSLPRRGPQRMTMAAAVAVAGSLLIVAGAWRSHGSGEPIVVSRALLAAQFIVIALALTAFRHAIRLPADLRGSNTFALAWPDRPAPFVAGVKRAGMIAVLVPTVLALFLWNADALGLRFAVLHLGVSTAAGVALIEILFLRNRRVPLVSVYVPTGDWIVAGVTYCALLLTSAFATGAVERAAFTRPALYVGLQLTLLGIQTCVALLNRSSPLAALDLDVDESTALPTQRLGLES